MYLLASLSLLRDSSTQEDENAGDVRDEEGKVGVNHEADTALTDVDWLTAIESNSMRNSRNANC